MFACFLFTKYACLVIIHISGSRAVCHYRKIHSATKRAIRARRQKLSRRQVTNNSNVEGDPLVSTPLMLNARYLHISQTGGQSPLPIGIQRIYHKNHRCTLPRHGYTRMKFNQSDVSRQSKGPVTVNHPFIGKLC
ncbi:hypothetical protein ASPBRDRAFT_485420 [Aspergillus brasiliensis CBS 101740]|uniref:Secreted protein n=1 Tax=Aspergillus brasiliensis (strain CBS 101740 / IMI 381727 / IBT 21946) TaxID=767769 RepID=A0A1L9UUH7_ASPBC|nr:hypothetical protein ASPBRDRAFT_485420 [Aspergillus brasiliensis CBS 101740]